MQIFHIMNIFKNNKKPKVNEDSYESVDSILNAIPGLDALPVICAIDMTGSNTRNGRRTYGGLPLHTIRTNSLNPYEQIITLLGELATFNSDISMPAYYFGCTQTQHKYVGVLSEENSGYRDVLCAYRNIFRHIKLGDPTSFKPVIDKAIEIVRHTEKYHLLVILCDGEVSEKCKKETSKAIIEASRYPLSIVIIGIGDGPWDKMCQMDDDVKGKKFDNVQFVCANDFLCNSDMTHCEEPGVVSARKERFLTEVLQEIPQQYKKINELGLFKNCSKPTKYKFQTETISHPQYVSY